MGFLFGFPRTTESAAVAGLEDLKHAIAASNAHSASAAIQTRLRANTNLERIVDWLMTLIVGATLVNLSELVEWAVNAFSGIGAAITRGLADAPHSIVSGSLLFMPFTIGGFLHLYLWARRYLPGEWRAVEDELVGKIDTVEKKIERMGSQLWAVGWNTLDYIATKLRKLGVDEGTLVDVRKRYAEADTWDADPFKEFGPISANGFRLSASLKSISGSSNPHKVTIALSREDEVLIEKEVVFLLHNTFANPVRITEAEGTRAICEINCSESFFVGAIVPKEGAPSIRLSIDLASLGI